MSELEDILNMLDCGVVKIVFNGDKRSVEWANDAFYSLTGSTRRDYENELKSGNPRNVLHPDDFEWVFDEFKNHVKTKKPLNIQYRVFHKNGSIVWLDVFSNFVGYEGGNPCFINIMRDITDVIEMQELIDYEHRRYQLICELSGDLLFEYDIKKDRMINNSKNSHDFDIGSIDGFFSKPEHHGLLPEESITALRRLFSENIMKNKQVKSSDPIQIMTTQGLKWFTVTCGLVNRAIIGKLTDVDNDFRLISNLRQNIQIDGQTDLLNKTAVIKKASQLFNLSLKSEKVKKSRVDEQNQELSKSHAMVILDIDNFKQINDTFGHDFGDRIIQTVAESIKESFRQDDLKGRFGGDESIVIIKDVTTLTAQQLVERYRQNLVAKLKSYKECCSVTNSIGISFFPQHGKTFEELFKKADSALYQSKKQGKNQATLFIDGGNESPHAG